MAQMAAAPVVQARDGDEKGWTELCEVLKNLESVALAEACIEA